MNTLTWALQRLARRRGKRRLPRPPLPLSMIPQERAYRSDLLRLLDQVQAIVREQLFPELGKLGRSARGRIDDVRADAWNDEVKRIFTSMRTAAAEVPLGLADDIAAKHARAVDVRNLASIRAQMRAVIQVDVFINTPRTAVASAAFVQENVALIKSIPSRYFDEMEALVLRGFRAGTRGEDIEHEIMDRFGVSQSRAALLARDQVSKLNGDLTRERQTALGISRYVWRTSKDERVRESHNSKEGEMYSWDDPPADTGHPGEDIQCRCHPEPVMEGLL